MKDQNHIAEIERENRELRDSLDRIFSHVSYVNIHGAGEQPAQRDDGQPQAVRISPEEFWRLFQEIGRIASKALRRSVS